MLIQQQIRNIIFYYVKTHYNNYLKKNNIKFIDEKEIGDVIKKMYIDKKKDLQLFIKTCLKEMMKEEYPNLIVENILYDIFQDPEMAINRVTLEIKKYQDYIINNNFKEYEITFSIEPEFGIGLKIDILDNDVVVKNYKRNNNNLLPAEKSGKISIGDSFIKVNNINILNLSTKEKINVIKEANTKEHISLVFRTFIENINV